MAATAATSTENRNVIECHALAIGLASRSPITTSQVCLWVSLTIRRPIGIVAVLLIRWLRDSDTANGLFSPSVAFPCGTWDCEGCVIRGVENLKMKHSYGSIAVLLLAPLLFCSLGCRSQAKLPGIRSKKLAAATSSEVEPTPVESAIAQVNFQAAKELSENAVELTPPTVDDFQLLPQENISLDDAVQRALGNSQVIQDHGGRVLTYPDAIRTTLDPAVIASDPNIGVDAALSAFDTQFETALVWNGGGSSVNSAFSTGQFGVFSQPETMAKVGWGQMLRSGTKLAVGGVGGYDEQLAGGLYAAYGAELRHPLMRGAGVEFNDIAGPFGKPGLYRGVLISQIGQHKAQLEVEKSVRDLVRDVSVVYWELAFAYENLSAKQKALDNAYDSWQREQERAAANVSPADVEAIARQQYYSAVAAVRNAIAGTGQGQTGVYAIELKLRTLLGMPACDGRLLHPSGAPLKAAIRFDWQESNALATTGRLELRIQQSNIDRRILERKAAKNLRRPQVDIVGQYRRLADDPTNDTELFSEALQGWQVGIEYRRSIQNRRENAAIRNADLQLSREHALADAQRAQISSELRTAFIELDRALGAMHYMALSHDAAMIRLNAQTQRHAAGDAQVEHVLEAQIRATRAETQYQRSVIDYNLAFIKLHYARGTLLKTMGVGFGAPTTDECRFALNEPSVFAQPTSINDSSSNTQLAQPPAAAGPGIR